MTVSGLKAETSDNPKKRGRQRTISGNPVGQRILDALNGREQAWLAEKAGINPKTLSDCIQRGIAKTDPAMAIAAALGVSLDWLLKGSGGSQSRQNIVAADDADWVSVAEYNIRELEDGSRGPLVSETPFRRDWLKNTLGVVGGIWLARLPAEYPPLGLAEEDLVFVRDIEPDEPRDRALYIMRIDGISTVYRVDALADTGNMRSGDRVGERVIGFRHFAQEDNRPHLVARVLGVPFKRV